jgi:hypothetical protein
MYLEDALQLIEAPRMTLYSVHYRISGCVVITFSHCKLVPHIATAKRAFPQWILQQSDKDPTFRAKISFTDELAMNGNTNIYKEPV